MIILSHYKETNKILQHVLNKKPLPPIVCTEKMKGTASYPKTILHSIQQPCLPYNDANKGDRIKKNAEELLGMEFTDQGDMMIGESQGIKLEIRPQDNGELHIGIEVSSNTSVDSSSLLAGMYNSFQSIWQLPELHKDLGNPTISLGGNEELNFNIDWRIEDEDTYNVLKEHYHNELLSKYVTFIDEEDGILVYKANIVDQNVQFNFEFNDSDKMINMKLYIN